jgi:hypothetical protein
MDVAVRVQAKVTGQRRSGVGDHGLTLTLSSGTVDAGEFLDAVVTSEVAAFAGRAEERSFLRLLTETELRADLDRGRVRTGGVEALPAVDVEAAVAEARLAFQDGLFKVFVDEHEIEELTSPVPLGSDSTVLFLRLVPLAGG